ncbi:hypothetical protein [Kurthia massiliensis]|uniref:hypothetical protein n=1 Tax=Kurthia massiliensis TaxID=1033739 RepID=UPI000288CF0D|nr:hypothetical protein [Kurthia massiliensis]
MKRLLKRVAAVMVISASIFAVQPQANAASTSEVKKTMKFSDGTKVSTLFFPYRDPANAKKGTERSMQGMTTDEKGNYYVMYATGDKTKYGYIYKYNKKFKLVKMSKKLTIGHGQAIDYRKGYLYQIADIVGNKNYQLQRIDPTTLKVKKKWTIPAEIHPNVIAMESDTTAIVVSKVGNGYDLNRLHIGEEFDYTIRNPREKLRIEGLVGTTKGKEVQGFSRTKDHYYLLSNGEYIIFKHDGTNIKKVKLNTDREPEGLIFNHKGQMLVLFNKINEVLIGKGK